MTEILAIRDNETGTVVELRELTADEQKDTTELYAARREKYPPPRFDIQLGMAQSLEAWTQAHPKFRRRGNGGGDDGTSAGAATGTGSDGVAGDGGGGGSHGDGSA